MPPIIFVSAVNLERLSLQFKAADRIDCLDYPVDYRPAPDF
jgi:hypothetical protein